MKVRLLALCLLALFVLSQTSLASNKNYSRLEDDFCAYGSHRELHKFFAEKNYLVIAQGKRIQTDGKIKDFADVILLLSPDMEYFHVLTLNAINRHRFKACIFSTVQY